jgi:hypothetical protein
VIPKIDIYLGVPYSHDDPQVRLERFQHVTRFAAKLADAGLVVFSPITMTHPMVTIGTCPSCSWDYWEKFDTAFLLNCKKLIVYKLPGWEQSEGLTAEIKVAKANGIPVEEVDPQY